MPLPSRFLAEYEKYRLSAISARNADDSEHQRRELFLTFVIQAFGVEADAFNREKVINMANVQRKGYLDALFGELIFEFKRTLDKNIERSRQQLGDYLTTLSSGKTQSPIGILTDGINFEVNILVDGQLHQTDSFNLETTSPEQAFVRLDAYLFSQNNVSPTADDVVKRFGGSSPTFLMTALELRKALNRLKDLPALAVWRGQWDKLVSRVYGSSVGDDELFLRHTYLSQFAKLLAYAALRGIPKNDNEIASILSGEAFYGENISNISEQDFFSWVLLDEVRADTLDLFRRLAEGLLIYDLSRIDQDLLKQLYQNLVDPATRHELGEYYTPDWLAELTLDKLEYKYPDTLLDPACGSGSFLFSAIKRLEAQGLQGWNLVEFAVNSVVGMDVHPLAVTIARINYLLALSPHLRSPKPAHARGLMAVPIYMADALAVPELEPRYKDTLVVTVDERRNESFFIPVASAAEPDAFNQVIDQMQNFADHASDSLRLESFREPFGKLVHERFAALKTGSVADMSGVYWQQNLRLLANLVSSKRDSIWSYILKNVSRPIMLAERKFDVIAGNPPWLSYRFLQSKTYQEEVKRLYIYYELIEGRDRKLFTQMDLSTLFYKHALKRYLKAGGRIGFVMPRAVITGAKQHRKFQEQGFSHVLDLLGVFPLFNVPTCVLIDNGKERHNGDIPATYYDARLPEHEMSWSEAAPHIKERPSQINFVDSEIRSPYYYERFKQGASLVPRNLIFIKPESNPNSPAVVTEPDANVEAKAPWKGVSLAGVVDDAYVYATLLSKFLFPFGYEKLHLVALPAIHEASGKLKMLNKSDDFVSRGHFRSKDWFDKAEKKWAGLKKENTDASLSEWVNYQNKLEGQKISHPAKVLYTTSGVHLAACVVALDQATQVYGRRTQGFVVDTKTYFFDATSLDEAHYLCALLNAPGLDEAIKNYQARGKGIVGQRDIHRTPFEATAIPPFDSQNEKHCALALLSQEAHQTIASANIAGGTVKRRRMAREAVDTQIKAIDVLAKELLAL
jgi:hypothetical protein